MNKKNILGVHAILITPDKKIILQQKTQDYKPNPGKISMFGGKIEPKEKVIAALIRELDEELEIKINSSILHELGTYYKNQKQDGVSYGVKIFFVENIKVKQLKLKEGEKMIVKKISELIKNKNLTRITKLALLDLNKRL